MMMGFNICQQSLQVKAAGMGEEVQRDDQGDRIQNGTTQPLPRNDQMDNEEINTFLQYESRFNYGFGECSVSVSSDRLEIKH